MWQNNIQIFFEKKKCLSIALLSSSFVNMSQELALQKKQLYSAKFLFFHAKD